MMVDSVQPNQSLLHHEETTTDKRMIFISLVHTNIMNNEHKAIEVKLLDKFNLTTHCNFQSTNSKLYEHQASPFLQNCGHNNTLCCPLYLIILEKPLHELEIHYTWPSIENPSRPHSYPLIKLTVISLSDHNHRVPKIASISAMLATWKLSLTSQFPNCILDYGIILVQVIVKLSATITLKPSTSYV